MKTSELIGPALDWAVAKCRGFDGLDEDQWLMRDGISDMPLSEYNPSTEWSQGGTIIEKECIQISCLHTTGYTPDKWEARHPYRYLGVGPTPLIAAMRCFVAFRLGGEIDIPEELT